MTTHTIDATDQSLGRLASRIAIILRGKDKASYTPNQIPDVEVIISNIDKVKFTGTKLKTTVHHRYSGYPGGLYTRKLEESWARDPKQVVRDTIYGMLPENRSRDKIMQHIKFQ